jgi:hypothetical protein
MIAAYKAGGFGFEILVKPVHPQELIRKLKSASPEVQNVA